MKTNFLHFFCLLFLLYACKKSDNQKVGRVVVVSKNVNYQEDSSELVLQSGKFTYQFPKNELPFNRVVLLNDTMLGYLLELGLEHQIVGVASPEYIYSDKIHTMIKSGKIQVVGNDQKYDVEKIITLKPDAIFTNYIPNFENVYTIFKNNGIKVIFLDEYLEATPLEKSAYLKVFGKLFGVEAEAHQHYLEIEQNYNQLKKMVQNQQNNPRVLSNEMYGNQWFVPGGATFVAQYYQDAGADYIFKNLESAKAEPLSFEEVYTKAASAEYWMNLSNHRFKKELLAVNPAYAKMKVFQTGQLYGMAKREKGSANDYFESGTVRADWVLRDYIKVFYPDLLPQDTLFYLNQLK